MRTYLLATLTVCLLSSPALAQPDPLDDGERRAVVTRIGELLEQRYVFADVAGQCAEHLRARLEAGEFDTLADPAGFAARLTETLQSVSHDKHMRVGVRPPARAEMERENPARARARWLDRQRRRNYGFEKVERLEGNIGYVDMRYFAGSSDESRAAAAAAMGFVANADALVFDMRQNGGGNPDMIRFVCSYLFDERTHLNSLYWREGDRTQEFWTLDEVPGRRLADVPVFVLTSSYTFSGAEEFSYNLQTRKRATLIGETTGGGANPGGAMPINQRFDIFVPTGRAINPVTGTNWEGVGVEPDVPASADDAYDIAIEMARTAADQRRSEQEERTAAIWNTMAERQATAAELAADGQADAAAAVITAALEEIHGAAVITAALEEIHGAGQLAEPDINMLGYDYLGRDEIGLAVAVFKFNVEAYPESGNVYDSLGEAYMNAGEKELAIRYYRRSLEIDPANTNAEQMIARMEDGDGP